jgi:hypothetical protein
MWVRCSENCSAACNARLSFFGAIQNAAGRPKGSFSSIHTNDMPISGTFGFPLSREML